MSNAKKWKCKVNHGVRGPSRVRQPYLKLGHEAQRARRDPPPPAGTSPSLLIVALPVFIFGQKALEITTVLFLVRQ